MNTRDFAIASAVIILLAVIITLALGGADSRPAPSSDLAPENRQDSLPQAPLDLGREERASREAAASKDAELSAADRITAEDVLRAFGWQGRYGDPAVSLEQLSEALKKLRESSPTTKDSDGADRALAVLAAGGLTEEQAAEVLDWAKQDSHRFQTRDAVEALVGAGLEGEALAGDLFEARFESALAHEDDVGYRYTAGYGLDALVSLGATGASPSVRNVLDQQFDAWFGVRGSLETKMKELEAKALAGEVDRNSPGLENIKSMVDRRYHALKTTRAYLELGSEDAIRWAMDELDAGLVDPNSSRALIVADALQELAGARLKGRLLEATQDWLRAHWAGMDNLPAWASELGARLGYTLGADASERLLRLSAKEGPLRANAFAALLDLEADSGSKELRAELVEATADFKPRADSSPYQDMALTLDGMRLEQRFGGDLGALAQDLGSVDSGALARYLELTNPELNAILASELLALAEQLGPRLAADPFASTALRGLLDRAGTDEASLTVLEALSKSPTKRLAGMTLEFLRRRSAERPKSLADKIAALQSRSSRASSPFYWDKHHGSAWDEAVVLAAESMGTFEEWRTWLSSQELDLGLRVALYRGYALRDAPDIAVLKEAGGDLVAACRASFDLGEPLAPLLEPAQWKSMAWAVVTHDSSLADGAGSLTPEGIGETCLAAVGPETPGLPDELRENLQLLQEFLAGR